MLTHVSGSIFALLAAVLFALNSLSTRRAVVRIPNPASGIFITVFLALPFYFLILSIGGRLSEILAFSWQGYLYLLAAGIVHFIMGRSLNYRAVRLVGANMGTILQRTNPVVAVIWGVSLFHESLGWQELCGVLLVTVGISLIAWRPRLLRGGDSSSSRIPAKGILFGLGAGFFYGTSPVFVKLGLGNSGHPVAGVLISYIGASAVLGFLLSNRETRSSLVSMDRGAVRWFCVTGVLVAMSQLCRYLALSLSPVSIVSPLVSTTPMLVIFFSFLFNRKLETFTFSVILAGLATVAGTILLF